MSFLVLPIVRCPWLNSSEQKGETENPLTLRTEELPVPLSAPAGGNLKDPDDVIG